VIYVYRQNGPSRAAVVRLLWISHPWPMATIWTVRHTRVLPGPARADASSGIRRAFQIGSNRRHSEVMDASQLPLKITRVGRIKARCQIVGATTPPAIHDHAPCYCGPTEEFTIQLHRSVRQAPSDPRWMALTMARVKAMTRSVSIRASLSRCLPQRAVPASRGASALKDKASGLRYGDPFH